MHYLLPLLLMALMCQCGQDLLKGKCCDGNPPEDLLGSRVLKSPIVGVGQRARNSRIREIKIEWQDLLLQRHHLGLPGPFLYQADWVEHRGRLYLDELFADKPLPGRSL